MFFQPCGGLVHNKTGLIAISCGSLNSYLCTFLIGLSHLSQGTQNHTFRAKSPSQETTQNTPHAVACFLAKYWMVKFMLWQPQLKPIPTPTHEPILHNLKDSGLQIWSPWGPHQSTYTMQHTPTQPHFL